MTLARRLWMLGALLPAAATLAALLLASVAFEFALLASLDRALLTQAAVESESLFDRTSGPHLHMESSPLEEQVRPFAPGAALFDPAGNVVARFPPNEQPLSAAVVEGGLEPGRPPTLLTRELPDGSERRELSVAVQGPDGGAYVLVLGASLGQLQSSVRTFRQLTLTFAILLGLLLFVVQGWQARRLSRRIGGLATHAAALHAGRLDAMPPADAEGDEVTALRDVLADATRGLREARSTQDRLVADAAHELRTPLTVMRTNLDLALRRERSNEELREALRTSRDEVDRLALLSTRLLDLAALRGGQANRVEADVVSVVRESIGAVSALATGRDVRIELAGDATLVARVDPDQLRQALDNLLANALRYAPSGSAVTVEVQGGTRLRVAVTDHGPGIPEAEREAVFEPFHRLDHASPGTGLGLSIVRDIARAHGGRAYVESPPGGGTRVVVELSIEN